MVEDFGDFSDVVDDCVQEEQKDLAWLKPFQEDLMGKIPGDLPKVLVEKAYEAKQIHITCGGVNILSYDKVVLTNGSPKWIITNLLPEILAAFGISVQMSKLHIDIKFRNKLTAKLLGCTPSAFARAFDANMLNLFIDTDNKRYLINKYGYGNGGSRSDAVINTVLELSEALDIMLRHDLEKLIPYTLYVEDIKCLVRDILINKPSPITIENLLDVLKPRLPIEDILDASITKNKHAARHLNCHYSVLRPEDVTSKLGTPSTILSMQNGSIPTDLCIEYAKKYKQLGKVKEGHYVDFHRGFESAARLIGVYDTTLETKPDDIFNLISTSIEEAEDRYTQYEQSISVDTVSGVIKTLIGFDIDMHRYRPFSLYRVKNTQNLFGDIPLLRAFNNIIGLYNASLRTTGNIDTLKGQLTERFGGLTGNISEKILRELFLNFVEELENG